MLIFIWFWITFLGAPMWQSDPWRFSWFGRSLGYNNWAPWLGYGDMGRYTGVENINMRSIDFDIFHYNHEFGNAYSDMKRIVLHWSKPLE